MQTDALILHAVRKEVAKTLKELMETRKKQELAATKIQAVFRGYRTRKLRKVETKATDQCILFKDFIQEVKDTVSPNRQSISVSIFLLILHLNMWHKILHLMETVSPVI
jgi:hypothetical protein